MINACPVCSAASFELVADNERLQEECRIREQFVQDRLTRKIHPEELKDLTDFFHGEQAHLVACSGCGLLIRDEHERPAVQEYSEDEYAPSVMEHQYPCYVEAFRAKADPYRPLLPASARVLEIGSHYGAFLKVAQEWGWRAEGVDPGKDTSRFAASKGFHVHAGTIEDGPFAAEQFDAIFNWNCFDQIDDPRPTLARCRVLLKRGGLLTVRTPDGEFYRICERLLQNEHVSGRTKDFVLRALGYNNLLGFPYRYGYSRDVLKRLIEPFGFTMEGALSSELLTFPLPENPRWVLKEEEKISAELELLDHGPWLETWFRKTEQADSADDRAEILI